MPIRDLLWACPACRQYGVIHARERGEACGHCGAVFEPSANARIRVSHAGSSETRTAADWEKHLPPIDAVPPGGALGPQNVTLRLARKLRPVRHRGNLIGWAERFGKSIHARARLDPAQLAIESPDQRWSWPLESITAVQPSSSTLQINSAGLPLASIRFLQDSVRRWEAVLQLWIRQRHSVFGHGEIVDFFPRIRVR